MKNDRKRLILFWLSFYSLFGAWKIVGMICFIVLTVCFTVCAWKVIFSVSITIELRLGQQDFWFHTHTHTHACTHTHTHIHAHVHTNTHTRMRVHAHPHTSMHRHTQHTHTHTHTHTRTLINTHSSTHTHTHTLTHTTHSLTHSLTHAHTDAFIHLHCLFVCSCIAHTFSFQWNTELVNLMAWLDLTWLDLTWCCRAREEFMCHMKINVSEQSLQMEQAWTLVDSDGEEVSLLTVNGFCWPYCFTSTDVRLLIRDGGGEDERMKARPRIPPEKDRRDRGPPPEQWKCQGGVPSPLPSDLRTA